MRYGTTWRICLMLSLMLSTVLVAHSELPTKQDIDSAIKLEHTYPGPAVRVFLYNLMEAVDQEITTATVQAENEALKVYVPENAGLKEWKAGAEKEILRLSRSNTMWKIGGTTAIVIAVISIIAVAAQN